MFSDCGNVTQVNNSDVTTPADLLAGSMVEYTCKLGFIIEGNSTVECTDTGEWTQGPTCDKSKTSLFCICVCINTIAYRSLHDSSSTVFDLSYIVGPFTLNNIDFMYIVFITMFVFIFFRLNQLDILSACYILLSCH